MGNLNPQQGGSIDYKTIGNVGERIFIVRYENVPFNNSNYTLTGQIKLFEKDNAIEIHIEANHRPLPRRATPHIY